MPTVDEVVQAFLGEITAGCRSVGDINGTYAALSDDARDFFARRYSASIAKKLHDTPTDWPNQMALNAAFAHGQIAGAIWLFWQKAPIPGPDTQAQIDRRILAKAGHIMELECDDFVQLVGASKGLKGEELEKFTMTGAYCW